MTVDDYGLRNNNWRINNNLEPANNNYTHTHADDNAGRKKQVIAAIGRVRLSANWIS